MRYNGHSESSVKGDLIPFRLDGELEAWDKLILAVRNTVKPARCPNDGRRLRVDGSVRYEGKIGKDATYVMQRIEREYACPKCHLISEKRVGDAGAGYVVRHKTDGRGDSVEREIVVPTEDGRIVVFLRENGKPDVGLLEYDENV